jgi:hypothetical protein
MFLSENISNILAKITDPRAARSAMAAVIDEIGATEFADWGGEKTNAEFWVILVEKINGISLPKDLGAPLRPEQVDSIHRRVRDLIAKERSASASNELRIAA